MANSRVQFTLPLAFMEHLCAKKYSSIRRMDVWQDTDIFIQQNLLLYDVRCVSLARACKAPTVATTICPGRDVTWMNIGGYFYDNVTSLKCIRAERLKNGSKLWSVGMRIVWYLQRFK